MIAKRNTYAVLTMKLAAKAGKKLGNAQQFECNF
jgi:hypothetical protein